MFIEMLKMFDETIFLNKLRSRINPKLAMQTQKLKPCQLVLISIKLRMRSVKNCSG